MANHNTSETQSEHLLKIAVDSEVETVEGCVGNQKLSEATAKPELEGDKLDSQQAAAGADKEEAAAVELPPVDVTASDSSDEESEYEDSDSSDYDFDTVSEANSFDIDYYESSEDEGFVETFENFGVYRVCRYRITNESYEFDDGIADMELMEDRADNTRLVLCFFRVLSD